MRRVFAPYLLRPDEGERVWLGIDATSIERPESQTVVDKFFKMEPNPLSVDLDGDGIQEVLVPVNDEEAGRVAVVYRGPAGFRMQIVQSGFDKEVLLAA